MMSNQLRDRVAVVTGASSGTGRATAELLAEHGALVAIFARSGETLRELAARHGGGTLEDVFMTLTGRRLDDSDATEAERPT